MMALRLPPVTRQLPKILMAGWAGVPGCRRYTRCRDGVSIMGCKASADCLLTYKNIT